MGISASSTIRLNATGWRIASTYGHNRITGILSPFYQPTMNDLDKFSMSIFLLKVSGGMRNLIDVKINIDDSKMICRIRFFSLERQLGLHFVFHNNTVCFSVRRHFISLKLHSTTFLLVKQCKEELNRPFIDLGGYLMTEVSVVT